MDDRDRHQAAPPLPPTSFYVLLSLAAEERHGYSIMQEVATLTSGAMRLWPGALYHTIQSLLADGLIAAVPETAGNERWRYYRLTERGRLAAAGETQRLTSLVNLARGRQVLPPQEDS